MQSYSGLTFTGSIQNPRRNEVPVRFPAQLNCWRLFETFQTGCYGRPKHVDANLAWTNSFGILHLTPGNISACRSLQLPKALSAGSKSPLHTPVLPSTAGKPIAALWCFFQLCNSQIPSLWSVQPPSFKNKPTGRLHHWMIIRRLYNKSTWSNSEQVSARGTIILYVMPRNCASFYLLK